jgi:hypothetical protein
MLNADRVLWISCSTPGLIAGRHRRCWFRKTGWMRMWPAETGLEANNQNRIQAGLRRLILRNPNMIFVIIYGPPGYL